MGSYDLYRELELSADHTCDQLAEILDARIRRTLDEGFSPTDPEVDQLVTARAVLADQVKRATYDAALAGNDDQVSVTWLHLLADARQAPARVLGTPAAPDVPAVSSPVETEQPDAGARDFSARNLGSRHPVASLLFLVGSVTTVLGAAVVDPSDAEAVGTYLRILVVFLGYVLCVLAGTQLVQWACSVWNVRRSRPTHEGSGR